MKETLEKLNKIKTEIIKEKTTGTLRLFILIERNDLENKWDLILSADWLEKNNSEKDLVYLIEKIKLEFGSDLEFLARIIVTTPNEIFIRQLTRAILRVGKGGEFEEIKDLQVTSNFKVKHIFVIAIDFSGIDLAMAGTDDGPLGSKEITQF